MELMGKMVLQVLMVKMGGNLLLWVLNKSCNKDSLIISAKGGNGSRGQDGGNGKDGLIGLDVFSKEVL